LRRVIPSNSQKDRPVNVVRPDSHLQNRLLSTLPPEDFALLSTHLKEAPLGARELLFETQDEIPFICFPISGMVSLFAVTDDGDTIETASVGREGAVGVAAALGIRRACCRALVQVPGAALRIPAHQMQRIAQDNSRVREILFAANESVLMQAQQIALCNALHGVDARLARWLLLSQERTGENAIPTIQEFLAQALGVRRTTVNLTIRTLGETGAIRYRRGRIEVTDRNALSAVSCGCERVIRRHAEQIAASDES
jgi:CRP-like cAMP-binding protein